MSGFDWGDDSNWKGNDNRGPRIKDLVDLIEMPDNEWINIRLVGNPVTHMVHWLRIKTKKGKNVSLRKDCLGLDPKTGKYEAENCPYCTLCEDNPRQEVYSNAIDRDKQENEPRKKRPPRGSELKPVMWNGTKHRIVAGKNSAWTPVRVFRATTSVGKKISEITSLNRKTIDGERKTFGPNHPKHGFDLLIKMNKEASPSEMYSVQKGDISPLTKEERMALVWAIPDPSPESASTAKKEAGRLRLQVVDKDGNLMFGDEVKPKSKGKKNEFRDEFDSDEDWEEETKSKKRRPKKKVRDDDDDWGDDDPKPKKKKKKKPTTKKRKPKKKPITKKRAVKKRRPKKDPDYDDDIPF